MLPKCHTIMHRNPGWKGAPNIMSAGSTPERATYQSTSLTPDSAPINKYAYDAGEASSTLAAPTSKRPEFPPTSPGSAGRGFHLETGACLKSPI